MSADLRDDRRVASPPICMLGLGLMGAPMALRLIQSGFAVSGWNRSLDKAEPLRAHGLKLASTAREAVAGAGIVGLCLTDAAAVEDVLFGPQGVAERLDSGSVVVDFSTVGVDAARVLGGRLAERGVGWVDAPVSGGPSGASAGRLAIFCGGEPRDVDRVRPILEALSHVYTHMGSLGAGQATKLCNQLIVSTAILAISEAVSLGRALGVDVRSLPKALAGGFADSLPLQIFGPRMVATAEPTPRISEVATMLKDVRLVNGAGAGGADLRLTRTVLQLYEDAASHGLSHEDLAVLPKLSQPGWRVRAQDAPP